MRRCDVLSVYGPLAGKASRNYNGLPDSSARSAANNRASCPQSVNSVVTRHAPGPWSLTWHQYGAYWCYEGEDWKQDSPAEREPSGKNGSAGPYFSQDPAGKLEPYACRTYLERNRGRETKARANL